MYLVGFSIRIYHDARSPECLKTVSFIIRELARSQRLYMGYFLIMYAKLNLKVLFYL